MKKFNSERRENQLEFLDNQESREALGSQSVYIIKPENGPSESCQSAGTASMLLNTKYQNVNVWINKGH